MPWPRCGSASRSARRASSRPPSPRSHQAVPPRRGPSRSSPRRHHPVRKAARACTAGPWRHAASRASHGAQSRRPCPARRGRPQVRPPDDPTGRSRTRRGRPDRAPPSSPWNRLPMPSRTPARPSDERWASGPRCRDPPTGRHPDRASRVRRTARPRRTLHQTSHAVRTLRHPLHPRSDRDRKRRGRHDRTPRVAAGIRAGA